MKKLSIFLHFILLLSFAVLPVHSQEEDKDLPPKDEEESLMTVTPASSAESFIPQTMQTEPLPAPREEIKYLWPEENSEKSNYRLIAPPSSNSSWEEPQPTEPLTWGQVGSGVTGTIEYTGGMVTGGLNKLLWAPYTLARGLWHANLPEVGNTVLDMVSGSPRGRQVWGDVYNGIKNSPTGIKNDFKAHVELAKHSPFLAGEQHGEIIETAAEFVFAPVALERLPIALKGLGADLSQTARTLTKTRGTDTARLPAVRPMHTSPQPASPQLRFTPLRQRRSTQTISWDDLVEEQMGFLEEEMAARIVEDVNTATTRPHYTPQAMYDASRGRGSVRWPVKIMQKDPTPTQTGATRNGRLPRCAEDGGIPANSIDTTYEHVTDISVKLKRYPPITRVIYDDPEGLGRTSGFVIGNERGIYSSIEDALHQRNVIAERGNIIRGFNLEYPFKVGDQVAYTMPNGTLAYQRIIEKINGSQLKLEDGKILELDSVVGVVDEWTNPFLIKEHFSNSF